MAGRIVFEVVVGVLAIYGLCEALAKLRARVFLPGRLDVRTLVLLKGRRRDLAELTSPIARRLWRNQGVSDVILVDAGLDETSRREADRLAERPENAVVIDGARLKEALKL